ncbi:MAG: hypothetical protein LWW99_11830 [Deltaproteobacteria bacterium]|nr:hypothetical protein [Deltaproteobacteria bacterium]
MVFWHIKIEDAMAVQDKMRITPLSRSLGLPAPEPASLRNLMPFNPEGGLLAAAALLKNYLTKSHPSNIVN